MPMDMPMPSPSPSLSPMQMPTPVPMPSPTQPPRNIPEGQKRTTPNLSPQKDWPKPVDDTHPYTFVLVDLLEYRPKGHDSDIRWDIEGWRGGGGFNRVWFKSEGVRNTTSKEDYDIDFQLLYGRFVRRYYDFQVGVRLQAQKSLGRNVARPQAVIALEGLAPYNYEIEAEMFISHKGDVSGRFKATKDLLITQRLILQPRFETNLAIQKVERFTTGRGLNNLELGFRLRYEIQRKFAPYVGISLERSFFSTADFVQQEGDNPRQVRFVMGVRVFY
jgi:copper resistance protein B